MTFLSGYRVEPNCRLVSCATTWNIMHCRIRYSFGDPQRMRCAAIRLSMRNYISPKTCEDRPREHVTCKPVNHLEPCAAVYCGREPTSTALDWAEWAKQHAVVASLESVIMETRRDDARRASSRCPRERSRLAGCAGNCASSRAPALRVVTPILRSRKALPGCRRECACASPRRMPKRRGGRTAGRRPAACGSARSDAASRCPTRDAPAPP
jgi:hypothetical protein